MSVPFHNGGDDMRWNPKTIFGKAYGCYAIAKSATAESVRVPTLVRSD